MISFATITLNDDKTWKFTWADTGADYYRIVLYGMEIGTTELLEYTHLQPGWEDFPPFIEVAEEEEQTLSERNLPYLVLQWYRSDTALYYEVQQLVDAEWVTRFIQEEVGSWVYTIQTANLEDETLHQFRVYAYDLMEQQSSELEFRVFIVRVPTIDQTTIDIGYANPNIVISAVP